ncbi:hypothetical protein L6654_27055 [Bradyrhizobium sp. WYCCWR 13023]|uniref:Uncharacterized protein n=1 Tax=Bradyrhizobium zhengyangense TaxID=2911009 RepID=A0A9X1RGS8_9BRAD|nr:hypothetical protein [Bradyrhizobium zhengyangense]MCG2630294.1 hypothetical protein [Bradyrhizobium zhengyangense]MCG2637821.1 hypothetical protein [Bradyrhizobium zhengyangense]MCG2666220.1 hypothetical protein [Bradyrhizobium zhengyangense]
MFLALLVSLAAAAPALAQVVADGNAALTGFSGVTPPVVVAPGVNPLDKTYIDPNGVSVRVVDLQSMGGPPQAQVVTAPKPFAATAAQVGQVFGITLDNASPPNIYVAATSAYGLPIVVPDKDGDGLADRVQQGAANASFMSGLFGPSSGGPGSIWRIDGTSGAVQLFANVTLNGAANPGPALGGLAFDGASQSIFVADRATGMIHQFGLDGSERGRFDHGVQGRPAAGAQPVPYNPAMRLDITAPAFSTENPATWRYAPAARLVFGLAVHDGRLYYAVTEGLQVWSVSIAGGSFGKDPRIEVTVPPSLAPTEISKILFDARGNMLLAERAAPTGDYAMVALAQEGVSRVLRYTPVSTGNPSGPRWQAQPDQYAIGFPAQMTNGNGGIAIGYRYAADGAIDRTSCGGFLWSTGERLRVANDTATTLRLSLGGPANVNGMQGNGVEMVAPANVPPWSSYFIDKDDRFDDPAARGQIGDIAIPLGCARVTLRLPPILRPWYPGFGFGIGLPLPPAGPFCPWPGSHGCTCLPGQPCICPPGSSQQPGLQCCPSFQTPGPGGQCTSLCANGANDAASSAMCFFGAMPPPDPNNIDYTDITCFDGTQINAQTGGLCPKPPGAVCMAGFTLVPAKHDGGDMWTDYTCESTPQENMCAQPGPNGHLQQIGLDGQCHELCSGDSLAFPTTQCCPAGMVPNAFGVCGPQQGGCPPQQLTSTGKCCPQGQKPLPNGECVITLNFCPPQQLTSTGQCCPQGQTPQPDGSCKQQQCPPQQLTISGQCCPQGQFPQANGSCGGQQQVCPVGQLTSTGVCCPAGETPQADGSCGQHSWLPSCPQQQISNTGICCPSGTTPQTDGSCQGCPAGTVASPLTGACMQQQPCPSNTVQKANGQCCPSSPGIVAAGAAPACFCPTGQTFDGQKCVGGSQAATGCFPGYTQLPGGGCCLASQATLDGVCCPPGQHPDANRRACVGTAPLPHVAPPIIRAPPVVVPPPKGVVVPPPHVGITPPPRIGVTPPPPNIGVKPPPRIIVTPPPHIGVTPPPRGGTFAPRKEPEKVR